MTQRIECFLNMTHRIEPLFFWIWLQELNFLSIFVFFFKKSQIWSLFNMTQRKWTGFPKFDSKNWTLFTKGLKELDRKRLSDSNNKTFLWLVEVNFFFCIWIKEIKPSFSNLWFKLLDLFLNRTHRIEPFKYDSQNRTLFEKMTHRIWTLLFNMSQRKWLHFWSWLKDYFFLHIWLKEQWSFLGNNDSKNWTFFSQNLRIDPFLPIWLTPRIQAFWTFSFDSKNWTLSWIWLKELDLFQNDSKNWTVSQNDSKNLTSFSQNDSKNWTFSSKWLKFFVLWIWLRIDFLIMTLWMILFCLLWL